MTTTVYVINIDAQGDMRSVLQRREALGNRIALLARHTGAPVWFHEFEDDMLGGAPSILLECEENFLIQVRTMPGYDNDHPVWPDLATKRSPRIQQYYATPGTPQP